MRYGGGEDESDRELRDMVKRNTVKKRPEKGSLAERVAGKVLFAGWNPKLKSEKSEEL